MYFYLRAKYHANLPVRSDRLIDDYIAIAPGVIYTVRVRQKLFGRIEVQTMREDDPLRELVGARITYPNLFLFFTDWEPKQTSLDPTQFTFNNRLLKGYHESRK